MIEISVLKMSAERCCVPLCDKTREDNVGLHVFPNPIKDPERFNIWKKTIGGHILSLENQYIFRLRRVCPLHFERKYKTYGKRLCGTALPTLNIPGYQSKDQTENDITKEDNNDTIESSFPGLSTEEQVCSVSDVNDINQTPLDQIDESSTIQEDVTIDISAEDNFASEIDEDVTFVVETRAEPGLHEHTGFKCDVCNGDVRGFRYTCLQCVDWDMCAACEARGEHAAHYVLRLPAPTTYRDHATFISAMRDHIEELLQSVNHEVYCKEEPVEEEMPVIIAEAIDPISYMNDTSVPDVKFNRSSPYHISRTRKESLAEKFTLEPNPTNLQNISKQYKRKHCTKNSEKSEITKVHKPNSESSVLINPEVMDSSLIETSKVKKLMKIIRLSASKTPDNVNKLTKRKTILLKKVDLKNGGYIIKNRDHNKVT